VCFGWFGSKCLKAVGFEGKAFKRGSPKVRNRLNRSRLFVELFVGSWEGVKGAKIIFLPSLVNEYVLK